MDEDKENKEGDNKPEHPQPKCCQEVYLELNKYFNRIKMFLEDKKYSVCAWKIVAAEIRRCFMIFYNFKKLLKIQSESPIFTQEVRNCSNALKNPLC
ncbi:interferon kappa [Phodopus roborovskii]|nr:interferon kappa [Phodopus roborovskii]